VDARGLERDAVGGGENLGSGDTDRGTGVGVPVMYEESCKPIDRAREF